MNRFHENSLVHSAVPKRKDDTSPISPYRLIGWYDRIARKVRITKRTLNARKVKIAMKVMIAKHNQLMNTHGKIL